MNTAIPSEAFTQAAIAASDSPRSDKKISGVCRTCGGSLHPFVDLGVSPLCQGFLVEEQLDAGETFYPLDAKICDTCWLAQLREYVPPTAIFEEYAYFSSFSDAWMAHAKEYVDAVIDRYDLNSKSFVLEIASNDGYLLRNVVARGIPCLGIEPAANVAQAAEAIGVPTRVAFFGKAFADELAAQGNRADLVVANNVLAQVPNLNDFVAGIQSILKPMGVATIEFPHLSKLIDGNQFDTIYHEHFSYFSLTSIEHLFSRNGLRVFDVEELWTHGGSLRIHACRADSNRPTLPSVERVREAEIAAGLRDLAAYKSFARSVEQTKHDLLTLLIELKRKGARIAGYGAPGKGNTLLNYTGIRTDLLEFTVDRNPYKWGRYLPGTRIPVYPPKAIDELRPDYVLILPWNLKDEISRQLAPIREWGGQLIVPIPKPEILSWTETTE